MEPHAERDELATTLERGNRLLVGRIEAVELELSIVKKHLQRRKSDRRNARRRRKRDDPPQESA